jgi:hypothetical protein
MEKISNPTDSRRLLFPDQHEVSPVLAERFQDAYQQR